MIVAVTGNGTYSANLHSLDRRRITSSLSFTDGEGNPATATGNAVALDTDKTEVATLTVDDTADNVINDSESTTVSFTVGGLDDTGTGTVTFTDGANHTVIVAVTGNGTYSANLHSLDRRQHHLVAELHRRRGQPRHRHRQRRCARHRQDRGRDPDGRRHRRQRHQQFRVDHRLLHGRPASTIPAPAP